MKIDSSQIQPKYNDFVRFLSSLLLLAEGEPSFSANRNCGNENSEHEYQQHFRYRMRISWMGRAYENRCPPHILCFVVAQSIFESLALVLWQKMQLTALAESDIGHTSHLSCEWFSAWREITMDDAFLYCASAWCSRINRMKILDPLLASLFNF